MHSLKVEAHGHYASISPKAELKVHVFLNVGHQRGCKVVTSGTSVKINVFFLPTCLRSLFIHCAAAGNVYGRAAEGLLRREKDVFSRQLSTHFGSAIYFKSWSRRWKKPVSCQCSYPL